MPQASKALSAGQRAFHAVSAGDRDPGAKAEQANNADAMAHRRARARIKRQHGVDACLGIHGSRR
jgi:hypothetical protein